MNTDELKKAAYKILAGIAIILYILIESGSRGDFDIFISASSDLWVGKNIYTTIYHEWYHYYYSIFFAILITPFTFLPEYFRNILWLSINLFFVYRIWVIAKSTFDISFFSKKIKILFVLLSFAFLLRLLRDNFHTMQVTILMLYLSLEGLNLIYKGKNFTGSFLIALGINIKILPIVILPYLFYRKLWKQGIMVITFYILLLFIPVISIGFKHNFFLLDEWWKLINPTNNEHIIDVSERSFHGLSTLIPTLLMGKVPDMHALLLKRNILNLNFEQVNIIINVARLFIISLTLFFLYPFSLKSTTSKLKKFWETSYIFLAVPLIFPHQQHYAFFFIAPAVIYLIYFLLTIYNKPSPMFGKLKLRFILIILAIVFLTVNLSIILGQFQHYYDHFKILTYGTILLIIPLMLCNPAYIEDE